MFLLQIILSLILFQVEAMVPQGVAAIINEQVNFTGPNCHNTSLRSIGSLKYKRYVSEEEMIYILNKFCKKLASSQKGSLGVFFTKNDGVPFHSFLFLNKNTVFTKNGLNKKSKPMVQSYEDMFLMHLIAYKNSCRIRGIKDCDLEVGYYQCQKIIGIPQLEQRIQDLLLSRETLLNEKQQHAYLRALDQFALSDNCVYESLVLKSLEETLETAIYATYSEKEAEEVELLRQKTADKLSTVTCSIF